MNELNKIRKYMLPLDTERLYKDEAISSISLSKEVANKINEIIEYINTLYKNDVEKEIEQDGKIRKAIVYMKDNLSNSLGELLEIMKSNGEIDNIIINTVNDSITKLNEIVLGLGNVLNYNAKGNGVSDDTVPLINASTDSRVYDKPFIVPEGKYLITSDIDLRGINIVDIKGDIITNNGSTVIIGSSSTNFNGIKVNIKKVPSLKVIGVKNSIIDINYCEKLHIFADGDDSDSSSTAYNQFYGAYAKEIILESVGTNIGWINENVFRIKRVEKLTIEGNYAHNNNHFEHINFEKGELNLLNGRNNYISARSEGSVTVNYGESSDVNHNFLEKEYYYKHYFGDDVNEDSKGTVSFYPVNKLQTERNLLLIDKYNKNYPISSINFKENGTFNGNTYNEIFHSNLIKIDKTFALKVKSDKPVLRVELKFYDINKNPIITEVDNFSDGKMVFNGESSEWLYSVGVNVDNDTINFYPGTAKYVEYRVIFGNETENIDTTYISLKLLKYINTDVYVTNTLKRNVYTAIPTSGYYEKGTILYGANPTSGNYVGIICTESGTPGVWKNFGQIVS